MFTAKHFQAIAELLKETDQQVADVQRYYPGQLTPENLLKNITESFAQMFERENPRFDRERFLRACK